MSKESRTFIIHETKSNGNGRRGNVKRLRVGAKNEKDAIHICMNTRDKTASYTIYYEDTTITTPYGIAIRDPYMPSHEQNIKHSLKRIIHSNRKQKRILKGGRKCFQKENLSK